ncbi:uncharacterized protein IWZ02DRAFT_288005 [Phyllosticta citriasiana]|uniref:Uncharacterized protein n=1 Tax=Phyllosticta citriasiana TaxID=595635 RepID=A0ABR1L0G0_9PEZI
MRLSSVSAILAMRLLSLTTIVRGYTCGYPNEIGGGTCRGGITVQHGALQPLCLNDGCVCCGDDDKDGTYGRSLIRVATRLRVRLTSMGYRVFACDGMGWKCIWTEGSGTECKPWHCEDPTNPKCKPPYFRPRKQGSGHP